jgi:hypothetical protein
VIGQPIAEPVLRVSQVPAEWLAACPYGSFRHSEGASYGRWPANRPKAVPDSRFGLHLMVAPAIPCSSLVTVSGRDPLKISPMSAIDRLLGSLAFTSIVLVIVWFLSPIVSGNTLAVIIATLIVAAAVGATWRVARRGRSV